MAEVEERPPASVSVALATYNGSRFLSEFLESVAAQTVRPSQLVVLDDTSTDGSVAIVERFARDAPFPVVLRVQSERRGFRDTFLNAAMLCTGQFVSFADQDDVWHPRKLEACLSAANKHGAVLCAHAADKVDANLDPIQRFDQGINDDGVGEPLTFPPWGVFYGFSEFFRRDLLDLVDVSVRPKDYIEEDHLLAHDRWVYILGTSLGKTALLSEPLALYRQHDSNVTLVYKEHSIWDRLRAVAATSRGQAVRTEVAFHVARLMAGIARGSSVYAEPAGRAAEHWSRIARLQTIRREIYGDGHLLERARMLSLLLSENAYLPSLFGGSTRAIMKDGIVGVLQAGAMLDGVFRLWPGLGRAR